MRSKLRVTWKYFDCFSIYLKDKFVYKIKQLPSLIKEQIKQINIFTSNIN